ncbi:SDR family oxidoreductase [Bradyrhizobium sp. NBAIM20]|uniref:NAD(P)-dependent oxidoreductase n=1 Tax=Bradyrhizobium sp. NBAIM20 TaxID=2793811 RepID=UPI002A150168|nr:SDR family oxidoreductase [Bradyrhizobium sp. NBAIM20]MCA1460648.1 SDR family oxidoreductase [Bradyrhizobium sp. NBAIM18]
MNVVVFGSTGSTGRLVVESALSAGHVVTAFVRDPKRMPLTHPNLRIVEGDAMDAASVASAVQGADAVICTLGMVPQAKEDLRSTPARCPGLLGGSQEHSGRHASRPGPTHR